MAKAQRPTVIVGGGGAGSFSFKLNTAQTRNVQQVLGKAKSARSSKPATKVAGKKRSK
jgi:hypothetical protein